MAKKGGYYAVANGRNTGVYNSWGDCESNVKGHSGSVYKKFDTLAAAQSFVSNNAGGYSSNSGSGSGSGSRSSGGSSSRGGSYSSGGSSYSSSNSYDSGASYSSGGYSGYTCSYSSGGSYTSRGSSTSNKTSTSKSRAEKIYTDGASRGNQNQNSAVAGYGVFYKAGDPRNISQPLEGSRQTNQRAELTAIKSAMENIVKEPKPILMHQNMKFILILNMQFKQHQNGQRNGREIIGKNQMVLKF
ncbi:unnamed protein product [[Candida] boidinii]|nr:unnamed protein product [[Candida] boidinii]